MVLDRARPRRQGEHGRIRRPGAARGVKPTAAQMPAPRLIDYASVRAFLLAHAEHKRATHPRWTFGMWARQLGLRHTATITRVLNGDREPGDDVIRALAAYFAFSPLEARYWECLVLRDRTVAGCYLRELAEKELELLHRAAAAELAEPVRDLNLPLWEMEGTVLSLQGWCEHAAAQRLLAPHGLRTLPGFARTLVAIQTARYPVATVGAYCHFFVAMWACVAAGAGFEPGVFLPLQICDEPKVAAFGEIVWGNPYHDGRIELESEGATPRGVVELGSERVEVAAEGIAAATAPVANHIEAQVFSRLIERPGQFRLAVDATTRVKPFDAAGDVFALYGHGRVAQLVAALGFEPAMWEFYTDVRCAAFPPRSLAS